MANRKQAQPV